MKCSACLRGIHWACIGEDCECVKGECEPTRKTYSVEQ